MGEHRIDWIANEGIRVSRLINHIKGLILNDPQRGLRSDLLEKEPPLLPFTIEKRVQPVDAAASVSQPQAAVSVSSQPKIEDGGAVWTIPLQVSVKLGTPTLTQTSADVSISQPADRTGTSASGTTVIGSSPAPLPLPRTDLSANKELSEALSELERAGSKKYYDEAQDKADRAEYYKDAPNGLDPAAFYEHLSELVTDTHANQPKYQPRKHVYPWVDLQPNLKLRSVYSGLEYDPEEIIREDFRIDQERTARLQERMVSESFFGAERLAEELDLLEAALPYNCEHVVPQSWFEKREPMRGDVHHLFACESNCNSFRGNTPYFDFSDFEEAVREECGMRIGNKFEPTAGKGAVARSVLYFLLRYPEEINRTAQEYEADRVEVLLSWHKDNEVTEHEKHRNMAIFKKQGNRNPLIDHPEWADRIDFTLGLG